MLKENAMERIYDLLDNNDELLIECMEALDNWNGYLQDDRYYEMEMLDEFYHDADPTEILNRAYFGYSEEYTDKQGRHTEPFNPNADYFRYNGYGNLVSTNYKDYSGNLDNYFIQELFDNYSNLDLPEEVTEIIDEYLTEEETA